MKKLYVGLLAFILVLTLCACGIGRKPAESAPEEPSTEETQPAPEPIRQLTCVQAEVQPAMVPAGEGCVLLCWTDDQMTTTYLELVDTGSDTVKRAIQLNGWWDLRDARFSDGGFVLCDVNNGQFRFLNQNLEDVGRFTPENTSGVFSHDRRSYFFLKDRLLYRSDLESGETVRVELSYDLRILNIAGIHPTKDQIGLHYFLSPYGSKSGTALLDLSSGKLLMLQGEDLQVDFRNASVCLLRFEEQEMAYSFTYGSNEAGFHLAPSSLFQNDHDLTPIHGSEYLLSNGENAALYRLGEEIAVCSLSDNGIAGHFYSTCFLPETESLIGGVSQNGVSQLYVLRPSQLSFSSVARAETVMSPLTVSPELGNAYWGALSGTELPADMDEVRSFADSLEERYGVHILLSGQCAEPCADCGYEIRTTDQMDYPDEPQRIAHFLNALDQCLALYPEGFFRQFRDAQGEGGICFMPVGKIVNDANIVGYCYERYEWNNIAVEVSVDGPVGILCHEIWHATENKILRSDYMDFYPGEWAVLNPPGFQYYGDIHVTDPDQQKWTLFGGDEEAYFIDGYARVNQNEDRARIMEYIMTKEDFADMMMASPAISAKLQRMCDAVRSCFDTTGWKDVRWERFLSP